MERMTLSVSSITTLRYKEDVLEHVQAIIVAHGGRMDIMPDRCILYFPEGTVKQLHAMCHEDHYALTLPDGLHLALTEGRSGNYVHFPLKLFPQEIQQAYQR